MHIEKGTKVQIYSPSGELIDEGILDMEAYYISNDNIVNVTLHNINYITHLSGEMKMDHNISEFACFLAGNTSLNKYVYS